MRYRLLMLALTSEFIRQCIMSEVVAGHNVEGMLPQRNCVLPVMRLSPCYCPARKNHDARRHPYNLLSEIGQSPGHDDQDSDHGKICISVSHRLSADLHESDNRHKHPNKPKPSHEYIRVTPGQYYRHGR